MESKQYKQSLKNIQGTIGDKDVLNKKVSASTKYSHVKGQTDSHNKGTSSSAASD